jgi:glycine betaine/choline ABC-type transport system substrate-binding protein
MLDGKISNDEMTNMNYLVEIEKMEAKDVAINFLEEKGLLK